MQLLSLDSFWTTTELHFCSEVLISPGGRLATVAQERALIATELWWPGDGELRKIAEKSAPEWRVPLTTPTGVRFGLDFAARDKLGGLLPVSLLAAFGPSLPRKPKTFCTLWFGGKANRKFLGGAIEDIVSAAAKADRIELKTATATWLLHFFRQRSVFMGASAKASQQDTLVATYRIHQTSRILPLQSASRTFCDLCACDLFLACCFSSSFRARVCWSSY